MLRVMPKAEPKSIGTQMIYRNIVTSKSRSERLMDNVMDVFLMRAKWTEALQVGIIIFAVAYMFLQIVRVFAR